MADDLTIRWRAWPWCDDEPDPNTCDYFETVIFSDYDREMAAADVMRQAAIRHPVRWDDSEYVLEIVHPESHTGRFTVAIDREPQVTAELMPS